MLRACDNKVMRIFGPKRDEVTGEWGKLQNEELNDLYSSLNTLQMITSRIMRWVRHVASKGERGGANRVLVGRPEGKRLLGRHRCRCEDNIKIFIQELE
jgi:hypothetical protein